MTPYHKFKDRLCIKINSVPSQKTIFSVAIIEEFYEPCKKKEKKKRKKRQRHCISGYIDELHDHGKYSRRPFSIYRNCSAVCSENILL